MVVLLEKIAQFYNYLNDDLADETLCLLTNIEEVTLPERIKIFNGIIFLRTVSFGLGFSLLSYLIIFSCKDPEVDKNGMALRSINIFQPQLLLLLYSTTNPYCNPCQRESFYPRSEDLFLIQWPLTLLGILAGYIYFVTKWGPQFMKNRKELELRTTMIIYNILQIIMNLLIFIEGFRLGWGGTYSWICQPVDWSVTPLNLYTCRICHFYFIIKLVDLFDTVFMVLRKRDDHISFLHVYHHAGMCLLAWGGTKYLPGGHGTFLGFVNSFVHAVMYCYYLLTSISPEYTRSLWWKKYLTQLQMAQFLMVAVHMSLVVIQPNCSYPKFPVFVLVPQNIFMFVLFCDFYYKAYVKKEKQRTKERSPTHTNHVKKNSKLRIE